MKVALAAVVLLGACAATIPKAELDRCNLGVADGNDAFAVRQGAACAVVAQRLAADEQPSAAIGYARKACDLQDARGCEEYLALVRGQPSLPPDELQRARATGEKACDGMVVARDGTDARPALCMRTAELYLDVAPSSRDEAGRLFGRACKLGDDKGCSRARSLGVEPQDHVTSVGPKSAPPAVPAPPPSQPRPSAAPMTLTPACHEMRPCVALDVQQRNSTEVVGSILNHCDRPVACTWCPSRGDQVDKAACRSTTLAPNESKYGRDAGLWYEGYNAIAYDCTDASDNRGCLAL